MFDAAKILQMHKNKKIPYNPMDDGFVFSNDEIETYIRRRLASSDWRALAPRDDFGVLTRAGCEWRALPLSTNRLRPISTGVKGQSARASGRQAGGARSHQSLRPAWQIAA